MKTKSTAPCQARNLSVGDFFIINGTLAILVDRQSLSSLMLFATFWDARLRRFDLTVHHSISPNYTVTRITEVEDL